MVHKIKKVRIVDGFRLMPEMSRPPEEGDIVKTRYGEEEVTRVLDPEKSLEEMNPEDRKRIKTFFKGYWEFWTMPVGGGETDIHDWSEWGTSVKLKKR
jgi:hypothetical protein